jgi:adenine-specific DNA-methyltransferase
MIMSSLGAPQIVIPATRPSPASLEKSLRKRYADGVGAHLAGTESEPFPARARRHVAVKVIDERGRS